MDISGSITLNGITDANFVKILQIKGEHGTVLNFDPRTTKPKTTTAGLQQGYDEVTLTWRDDHGLKAVVEILSAILPPSPPALAPPPTS